MIDLVVVFASCRRGSNCSLARALDAALALQHHWLLPINCHFHDCKARLVRFRPFKTSFPASAGKAKAGMVHSVSG